MLSLETVSCLKTVLRHILDVLVLVLWIGVYVLRVAVLLPTLSRTVCVMWYSDVELQLILDTEREENRLLREQLQLAEVW